MIAPTTVRLISTPTIISTMPRMIARRRPVNSKMNVTRRQTSRKGNNRIDIG